MQALGLLIRRGFHRVLQGHIGFVCVFMGLRTGARGFRIRLHFRVLIVLRDSRRVAVRVPLCRGYTK